jgi:hypothetical protein
MKTSALFVVCCIITPVLHGQCLTDFTKLLPEPAQDHTQNFGTTFSMYDDYLAVGLPAHDSLGRITGLVYIFEKRPEGWRKIASLIPSDPEDALQFGINVKMSADYVLVTASGYKGGKVYLFKKPGTGWETQTELTSFTYPNSIYFGMPWYAGRNQPVAISDDQQTIVIADMWYNYGVARGWSGALFVYHKQPHEEWQETMNPVILQAPEIDVLDFGRPGVAIDGDRVITGAPSTSSGSGTIYIYRDTSGTFSDFTLEAKLAAESYPKNFWLGYYMFATTDDGIFAAIATDFGGNSENVIAFFEKPSSGTWVDVVGATCTFLPGEAVGSKTVPAVATNGKDLFVSYHASDGIGYTTKVSKGSMGWCEPTYHRMDEYRPFEGQLFNRYGSVNTGGNKHAAVGILPHPENAQANLSIRALSEDANNMWSGELLYPRKKTTAGHFYGRAILGFEDFLFVGAPFDGTVKAGAGSVYVYQEINDAWEKSGKILAPVKEKGDNVFGTAIATNGTEIAIGAMGFGEHGRVFIYGKKDANWSNVELVQEIKLPEDILTVFSYGDNLAMNDEWLLIPYVQNNPGRIIVAMYRHNGIEWQFSQVVDIGGANLGAKFTTRAVAIEGNTIVAGTFILELNAEGLWERRYVLSPSDPELAKIAPDFSHWISNGSMFGHAVAISNNSIFISAPTKDEGSTWDVGAIYVYTKKPWEAWSSRTETTKLLPRVRDERELFGYSLNVLGNTLITGAPGSDYNVDGTARLKPGRAYVFQTEDFFWKHVTPLMDFTGDSFVKDYFGAAVALDETDFFISAPIEDIETGKLSGSVYVTAAPPIVKLVPPICSTNATIDLFGYPFGGSWTGPGIIDAVEGVFDPAVAGVGEHLFHYTTESCTYEGKLRISVEPPVVVTLTTDLEHMVCKAPASVNIVLGVEPHSSYEYTWYYRKDPADPFFPLNGKAASLTATYRGQYMVKVSNAVCESYSPVFAIHDEEVNLVLESPERICQDNKQGIVLSAFPEGGTWSGAGVRENRFFSEGLPDGMHTVQYTYRSALSCEYTSPMTIEVDRVPVPGIQRISGHLCNEGEVHLGISTAIKEGVVYTWKFKPLQASEFSVVPIQDFDLTVEDRGVYQLEAADGGCVEISNAIAINDDTFDFGMSPPSTTVLSCGGAPVMVAIESKSAHWHEWYRADSPLDDGTMVQAGEQNEYRVEESGYYYAVVQSGICEAKTSRKEITVHGPDEIWLPNIVTPNGDSDNERFTLSTNTEILSIRIVNRYGKLIFSGTQPEDWPVDEVAAGVYFAVVRYQTCEGGIQQVRSMVQVMK